jgi:hypothetical protein
MDAAPNVTVQHSAPEAPHYWQYETGGELRPAVQAYLNGDELTIRQCMLIRAYLRQWVNSPVWDRNPHGCEALHGLREKAGSIASVADIDACIAMLVHAGMDPL